MWSASGCVPITRSIERSHQGITSPRRRITVESGPPSIRTCSPVGDSIYIESPCPILRKDTVKSPCLSSRIAAYQTSALAISKISMAAESMDLLLFTARSIYQNHKKEEAQV